MLVPLSCLLNLSLKFRNPLDPYRNVPSTPERDRTAERECSCLEHLNMTSTDDRCNRSHSFTPPQSPSVPQPVFVNQANVHQGAGLDAPPLRYPMHVPPTMGQYPQAGYAGPAPILPQPVSGDIFGVGLGGPARYTTPYMSMQNAHAGPSHLQPPQRDLHGTGLNPPMPPMAPPQYLPPRPDFIYLGDDAPQRQMHSAGNAPGSQPEIHPHHRTLRPVRSDPAFNNIHRGHMAHREREASHRQSLYDQEFVSLHQAEREDSGWVIPDEQARHARNENRRHMHLPEQPPPQLHMDMSREHEWRQQRISALEPFCLNSRPTSVPPQETSHQAREHQERQQRIAELSTQHRRNEARRAASAQAGEPQQHDQRMAQWMAQDRMRKDAQRIENEMRREQAERDAQHLEDTMRREQEQRRAQHMQYEMARVQAREQQDHQQRIVQLEAQRIQNETRHLQNREAAAEREEDEHLSQEAEQF